jgi:hypothetical protein
MKTEIKYIPETWTVYRNTGKNPLPCSASGYGSKLPTRFLVFDGRYLRRVYAICWSNCASFYIQVRGNRLFIQDYRFDSAGKIYKNF